MGLISPEQLFNLENAAWSVAIRQSVWLYPALEVVHLVGIALLVGAAFLFDLRLLGFSSQLSVSQLAQHVLPWSRRGLWLVVLSGVLLFSTNATDLAGNNTFWLKMALLVLAGLNAGWFNYFTYRTVAFWEINKITPPGAKLAAVFSIVLWLSIIICGRWLAY